MKQEYRGDGTTTKQMKEAKADAVFVWLNHNLDYPLRLARIINRTDLKIVAPSWLDDRRFLGLDITDIILDHAFIPDSKTFKMLKEALSRIRK